jgi:arginyl-tRNA synthetase
VQANKGYGIKYDEDEVYMKYVRKNYWLIDNIQKPIRAFSTYSMKEIQDICSRLGISLVDTDGSKIHKKGLYENILSKL